MSPPTDTHSLPLVPASFYGIVLGLAGLANAWRAAHAAWHLTAVVGEALFAVAAFAWLVITVLYALKWILALEYARAEAAHPVQCCFIGLSGVATLLIAQGALPYARPLAVALFSIGASFTFGFGLWRTGSLWQGGRDAGATTPVLYLPLVAGGFVTAATAGALGWADWGEFAFGAALFSWLAIESVLLHRLYTAEPLAVALRPTLGIQLAPPAVGAASYLAIGGAPGLPVHLLIGYAIFEALLLARLTRWISEAEFGPAYWAFTFGVTALATAATRVAAVERHGAMTTLAAVLFGVANVIVLGIAAGTLRLVLQHRLIPSITAAT